MNYPQIKNPSSNRLKIVFVLAVLGAGLSVQPVRAADYKISWLDLSSVPYGATVADGTTFTLPGYTSGLVTVTYTSTTLNWIRGTSAAAQNGILTQGPNQYGWASVDYLTACNYAPPPSAIDYTLTFSFSGQPVPEMHLVLASIGLGGDSTDGPTIATVDTNGTFLGDCNIGTNFATTVCTETPGAQVFTLTNAVVDPTTGYFNTDFGVTLINGPVPNNLTVTIHQVGYDGIGFTIGLIETPCTNNCLAIYTPDDITVTGCSSGEPVSYSVNVSDACCSNCVTLVSDPASGSTFPLGTTTVTNTATDTLGNSKSCFFTVTVIQATNAPTVNYAPANIIICGQGLCGSMPDATSQVLATTLTPGGAFVSQDISPGTDICDSGNVNFTIQGLCGNATNISVPYYVTNCSNICLQVQTPSNIVVTGCVPVKVFYRPTVTDTCCTNFNVTLNPTNGSSFTPGTTTTVYCTVSDSCGDTNQSSFTVTVLQATNPPVVHSYPTNVYVCIGSNGCGTMPDATGEVHATTTAGGTVFVSQNIMPGTQICANTNVTFSVMDVCNNTTNFTVPCLVTNCALCLTVQCTNILVFTNGSSGTNVQARVTYSAPTINDPCCTNTNSFHTTFSPPSGSYFSSTSNTTVTCTVTDGCGNTNSCTFTVTIAFITIAPAVPETNNGDFNIIWSYPGTNVHLEYSPDLTNWHPIGSAVSPYSVNPAVAQRQFYRLNTN